MKISTSLKHLFIPHQGNDYRPHFFRELAVGSLAIISIFLLGLSIGNSYFLHRTTLGASLRASVLVDLANATRRQYNEPILTRNPLLDRAAQLKADDMATHGYFAHNSPQGLTPWHWFKEVGYAFTYAGENLAANFSEPGAVEDAWLNSPKHRENLLNTNFREIGMATVGGTYNNSPTVFVVQLFGTPAVQEALLSSEENLALQTLVENRELTIVKNMDPIVATASITGASRSVTYAPWYATLLYLGPIYLETTYKVLIALVLVALILMVVIEIKKQHYKHISYGVLLLITLTLLVFINRAFMA